MARIARPALPLARRLDEKIAVAVRFEWDECCQIELDNNNRPLSPMLDKRGAVYRLRFFVSDRQRDHVAWYIGQTDNIRRRMGNYRNPSADRGQATNRKIHDAIVNTNLFGGTVTLDRAVDVHGGEAPGGPLNLDREVCRLLVENAAILMVAPPGGGDACKRRRNEAVE